MATKDSGGDNNPFYWTPPADALVTRRQADPHDAHPTFILLRHPASPFPRTAFVADTLDVSNLQAFVFAYLQAANKQADLGLPSEWLQALDPADANNRLKANFGWMEIEWPPKQRSEKEFANPLASYRVGRQRRDGPVLPDQIIILVASERVGGTFLGSDFGLRVVLHARQPGASGYQLRITGMTAVLPFGIFRTHGVTSAEWSDKDSKNLAKGKFLHFGRDRAGHGRALALDEVFFRGVRLARKPDNSFLIEKRGTGIAAAAPGVNKPTPYAFVVRDDISAHGASAGKTMHIRKVALVANANVRLFKIDPASQGTATGLRSRRVTRSEAQLDTFRTWETIEPGSMDPLAFPQPPASAEMEVRPSPLVLADRSKDPGLPETVVLSGSGPAVRSNDFAAVSAFYNVENIFKRLEAYGVSVQDYFRLAKLPLKVAYRSGIRPGPGKDGNTINARVYPVGRKADFVGPSAQGDRPGLELQLALANLSHRARKPWDRNSGLRSPAEPLGIAADARIIWHEFGHVLLMAAVGELEFRFAHSAGDALAAIASDPWSQLASDPVWRGETFPWVFIPRRHDRSVLLGWSWGGTLHRDLAQVPDSWLPRMKSYWSEQILSSSLFRLYLCLGGDTPPAKIAASPASPMRERASHYSIFLIVQAIALMGGIAPANDPDYFITSLIDADIASNPWEAVFVPANGPEFTRVGGCAWKVIRWAFEAQGMYAKPGTITNAPGLPPAVDIYIADRRPLIDATPAGAIDYGPGNYSPVSLEWDANQLGGDVPPLWQAGASAIKVQGKTITVSAGNRGSVTATQVTVAVWWRAWPAGDPQPDWDNASALWTPCAQTSVASASVAAGAPPVDFKFTHSPPATRYVVFAAATCAADPANTDAATGFPCSFQPTPLVDLVSGDNNLGLRVVS